MTLKTAYKWVLKKWEWLAENSDGKLDKDDNLSNCYKSIPELKYFSSGCAFCEIAEYCSNCPLGKIFINYYINNSIYIDWAKNPTKTNARKMLKLLKSKEIKELIK